MRMPLPSSIVAPPVVIPITGAIGSVLVTLAEERALELDVRAVERCVVPVEAAARLGGAHQQRQQNAAEEGLVLVGARAGMCAREDRRRGLAPELVDGELCVGTSSQRVRVRLDERLDERSVLVERGPVVGAVLLEGEREIGAAFQLWRSARNEPSAKALRDSWSCGARTITS